MMLLVTKITTVIYFFNVLIVFGHFQFAREDFSAVSYNTTNPAISWQPGTSRSKRSIYHAMPELLKISIQYEGGPIINAKLNKQKSNLANEYLPVIGDQVNRLRNVMEDVGEFVMYHDADNCIAIVYFGKFEIFNGVMGLNHFIANLPNNFDIFGNHVMGVIRKPYVNKNHHEFLHIDPNQNYPPPSDTDAWEDFLRPFDQASIETHLLDNLELQPGHSSQVSEENTAAYNARRIHISNNESFVLTFWAYHKYYVETLVLVTRDVANLFKQNYGEEEYVAAIVRYHITYFNAINMLLSKLRIFHNEHFKVTVNIAKIVIEGDSTSFGFEGEDQLRFSDVTTKLPHFFRNHPDSYTKDSFDYVFVHTSRTIMDGNVVVDGISKHGQNMVEGRINGNFYETIPITVAKLEKFYANYAIGAQEVSRTLGVKIAPKENGLQYTGQCYSIMQRDGSKCNKCLTWTKENLFQILKFFCQNINRCFLLNEPRSLHPPVPIKGVTPHKQCQCLGYESFDRLHEKRVTFYVRSNYCSVPLRCHNVRENHIFYENVMQPFDGTTCGKKKVCWNGRCQKIGMNPTE